MISMFRRFLETWVARVLFAAMVVAFVFWGIGDVVRLVGTDTWVARVGDTTIEAAALQGEYQRAVSALTSRLPPGQDASVELRRRVGEDTLQRMITQAALTSELRTLRIVTPDESLRDAVRDMREFRGTDGRFDRQTFDIALRNAGYTEGRFLELLRSDLARQQLLTAVAAGAGASSSLTTAAYRMQHQKRSARTAEFAIAAASEAPTPNESVLRRWYDNHPDSYRAPEYRRIVAVLLTAERVGRDVALTEHELRAAWERSRADYATAARRSAEVLSVPDEAKAQALADQWRGGADWGAIQQAAQAEGAFGVRMDDATETQFPDPDLARAVFSSTPGIVIGPIKGSLGWFVIKVTAATPGVDPDFNDVRERVRERLIASRAADLVYERANEVDKLLASGTKLEELPAELSLIGIAGTLDAEGLTPEKEPAPIPGPTELRNAVIAAAFQTQKGDPPRLQEVQTTSTGGTAYFAVTVEDITPSALRPYDDVKERVAADWKVDQQRHHQEEVASRMLAALKSGQSFEDAATVAGIAERSTPLMTREETMEGVDPAVVRAMFNLKGDEPGMVETAEGFIVLQIAEKIDPDPKADAGGFRQMQLTLIQTIRDDLRAAFTDAVRLRAGPRVNQKALDQIVQP